MTRRGAKHQRLHFKATLCCAALVMVARGAVLAQSKDDAPRFSQGNLEVLRLPGEVLAAAASHESASFAFALDDNTVQIYRGGWKIYCTLGPLETVISSLDFAPDGKLLAGAGFDGRIYVWDAGPLLQSPPGKQAEPLPLKVTIDAQVGPLQTVRFVGNGLVVGGFGKTVTRWNVDSESKTDEILVHQASVNAIAVDPSTQRIASVSSDRTAQIFDHQANQQQTVCALEKHAFLCAAYAPGGNRLALGAEDNAVRLYDVGSKRLSVLEGHNDFVTAVAFGARGYLVSGARDGTVIQWDPDGNQLAEWQAHTTPVVAVLVQSGDRSLLTVHRSGSVKLWRRRLPERRIRYRLQGPHSRTRAVAVSFDGARVATVGENRYVRVWRTASGAEESSSKRARSAIVSVCWLESGRLVTGHNDSTLTLWSDTLRPERVLKRHRGSVDCLVSSNNGKYFASSAGNEILLWDAEKMVILARLSGHKARVNKLAFSKDSSLLASAAARNDGSRQSELIVWRIPQGKQWIAATQPDALSALAFAPDGQHFAVGYESGLIGTWSLTHNRIDRILSSSASCQALIYSPEGKTLAVGGPTGDVVLWNVDSGEPFTTLKGLSGNVHTIAYSPTGNAVAAGSEGGTVGLWTFTKPPAVAKFEAHAGWVTALEVDPAGNGFYTAGSDGLVRQWGESTSQPDHEFEQLRGKVHSLSVTSDGKQVLAGGADRVLMMWEGKTAGPQQLLSGHQGEVRAARFSPHKNRIATGGVDGVIRISTIDGQLQTEIVPELGTVWDLAWSPNGRFLAGCLGRTKPQALIWDAEDGKTVARFSRGRPVSIAFSPDGRFLLAGGMDGSLNLWEVESKSLARGWQNHHTVVSSVCFSSDGAYAVSGSYDRSVRLWDLIAGREVGRHDQHESAVLAVRFSKDERRILSGGADKQVCIWSLDRPRKSNSQSKGASR